MTPKVPSWFLRRVKDYDSALDIRWSPEAALFCLERRMSNTPRQQVRAQKREMYRIAKKLRVPEWAALKRKLGFREDKIEAYQEATQAVARHRLWCSEELTSLPRGCHFILFLPK